MANAFTVIRLILAVPFALLVARSDPHSSAWAGLALLVAIATDLADGPVARRTGTVSVLGGTLDHLSDFVFVTAGLAAAAVRGAVPWLLPALIIAAFAQYCLDSYFVHGRRALRGSRLGRYNGILYFVPLGGLVLVGIGLNVLRPVLRLIIWVLVLSTVVSMAQRLTAARRGSASPASRYRRSAY